jgi:hypothetical protein
MYCTKLDLKTLKRCLQNQYLKLTRFCFFQYIVITQIEDNNQVYTDEHHNSTPNLDQIIQEKKTINA